MSCFREGEEGVMELISRQVLELWNRYKPTIAVDAIEYDRELKKLLSTNLAQVGTDCISRQAAIEVVQNRHMTLSKEKVLLINDLEKLPSAQPETATITIGRTKGDVTMWYECDACGEPIDICDCYCRKCGRKLEHE